MLVRAKIFSMDFWALRSFTHNNVKIERYGTFDEYEKARDCIHKENQHAQTGILTINIPDEMEEKIEDYANSIITNLWLLLSLAHDHDVPIQGLWFFDVENGKEIEKGFKISAMRTGKPGKGICWNLHYGLDKFIQKTMPLLEDKTFVSKTNIKHAIGWYNEAQNTNIFEFRFTSLWIAMEGLANTYDRNNPGKPLLERREWKAMKKVLTTFLKHIGKQQIISSILKRFKFLRERHIEDKICRLLNDKKYGLDQYCGELRRLNTIRNDILHARRVDLHSKPSPFDLEHRLKRLLQKIIFKTLDFYDNDMIYHSIKDENLDRR